MLKEAGFDPSLSYHQAISAYASAKANRVHSFPCPMGYLGCEMEQFPGNETVLAIDHSDALLTVLLFKPDDREEWRRTSHT